MWDWDQPHPFDFRSPLILGRALNTSRAGGSEESWYWWALLASRKQVWVRALLQAFLPHQQKYINNETAWHLERKRDVESDRQTATSRFGPIYFTIWASLSVSLLKLIGALWGSTTNTMALGRKHRRRLSPFPLLVNLAVPFALLSVCPDSHPLSRLSPPAIDEAQKHID